MMSRHALRVVVLLLPLHLPQAGLLLAAETPSAEGVKFFETKIRPVLVESCYKCHSAQSKRPKGGLLLDSRPAIRKGGESGPAVAPGKPVTRRGCVHWQENFMCLMT